MKPNEKGYYKQKLLDRRKKYEKMRKDFFRIEETVDKVFREFEQERQARYRLTDGITELHRQSNQLENI